MLRIRLWALSPILSIVLAGMLSSLALAEKQTIRHKTECYIDTFCISVPIRVPKKRTDYNKDELLLLLSKKVPDSLYEVLLKEYDLEELDSAELESLGVDVKVTHTNGKDPLELSKKINSLYEDIEAATNNIYKFEAVEAIPLLVEEKYPKSLTGAGRALQYSTGKDVLIGMIDGPVDTTHRTFKGRVEQHSLVDYNKESVANLRHGTGVAGVLMSKNVQIGIAPDAHLYSISAFEPDQETGFSSSSALIAQAIDLAIKKKVDILNMSFSGGKDGLVEKMINKALSEGVLVVAACGNDNSKKPRYPAAIPGVIAVTAVDHQLKPYQKANKGKYIDVAAPGVGVLTTGPGNRYQLSSGTSMAAANVSGSLALLLAKKKNITSSILTDTATDLGQPGHDTLFGGGLINIYTAIQTLVR